MALSSTSLSFIVVDRRNNEIIAKADSSFEGEVNNEAMFKILQAETASVDEQRYFVYFEIENTPDIHRTKHIPLIINSFAENCLTANLSFAKNLWIQCESIIPLPLDESIVGIGEAVIGDTFVVGEE